MCECGCVRVMCVVEILVYIYIHIRISICKESDSSLLLCCKVLQCVAVFCSAHAWQLSFDNLQLVLHCMLMKLRLMCSSATSCFPGE